MEGNCVHVDVIVLHTQSVRPELPEQGLSFVDYNHKLCVSIGHINWPVTGAWTPLPVQGKYRRLPVCQVCTTHLWFLGVGQTIAYDAKVTTAPPLEGRLLQEVAFHCLDERKSAINYYVHQL